MPFDRHADPRPFGDWKEWISPVILIACCLLLRLPSLDRVALNPDESQYEAGASFLIGTHTSAFSLSFGPVYMTALFEAFAATFGPYSMFQVRVFVLLICLALTLLLYWMVRRETTRACGLVSGLVFLHYVLPFEGLAANSEWFSGAFLLLGVYLYAASPDQPGPGRTWSTVLSGASAGLALWFKYQASFMIFAVPAAMALQALARRDLRDGLRRSAAYGSGLAATTALGALPFLAAGSLREYLAALGTAWSRYVVGNELDLGTSAAAGPPQLVRSFFLDMPGRPILVVSYGFAALVLCAVALRLAGRRVEPPLGDGRVAVVFVCYLVTSMLAIRLGGRFYPHYYQFMVPPLAALFGLALHAFARARPSARTTALALAFVGLLVAERAVPNRFFLPGYPLVPWPDPLPAWGYLILVGSLLVLALFRTRVGPQRALVVLLGLEAGLLVVQGQMIETPRSLPHHARGFDELVRYLRSESAEGDRLFVWGWCPEIHSLTRLEAASRFTISQYVIEDYQAARHATRLDPVRARQLMQDLKLTRPRFIVDAWRRSWTMSDDTGVYRMSRYPGFELPLYLAMHYDEVGTFDDCDVYVRRRE